MDISTIVDELDVCSAVLESNLGKEFLSVDKASGKALRAARKAMKAGNYKEAIKYCDEGISILNNFKKKIKEVGANNGVVKGSILSSVTKCVITVLGIVIGASAVYLAARKINNTARERQKEVDRDVNKILVDSNVKLALIEHEVEAKLNRKNDQLDDIVKSLNTAANVVNDIDVNYTKTHDMLSTKIEIEERKKNTHNAPIKKLRSEIASEEDSLDDMNEYLNELKAELKILNDNPDKTKVRGHSREFLKENIAITNDNIKSSQDTIKRLRSQLSGQAEYDDSKLDHINRKRLTNKMHHKDVKLTKRLIDEAKNKATHSPDDDKISSMRVHGHVYVTPTMSEGVASNILNLSKSKALAGTTAAGVIVALTNFITNVKRGKNGSVEDMVKIIDVSIKALAAVKGQCQELLKSSTVYESYVPENIVDEYSEGIGYIVFNTSESVLDVFSYLGLDDLSACELYIDIFGIDE